MKYIASLLVAGSALAVSAPAFAQDANPAFTGPRVEANIGYSTTGAGSEADDDVNDDNDQDIDGLVYGATVGFDFAAGGALVGVEAEYTDSSAEVEFNDDGDFEGFGLGRVEAGRDLYVGARVGTVIGGDTLLYAKGGYTNARFNVVDADGDDFDTNFDSDGYRIGAGIEHAVSEQAFIKVEYRYSNYSEGEINFDDSDLPDGGRVDIDLDRHQIMAGVGVRF